MTKSWQAWLRNKLITHLRPGHTIEELLDVVHRAEAIQSDEQRRHLERIVDFYDTRVREVMIPRSEIKAGEVGASLAEIEKIMVEKSVTRLPIIDGELDHILGVVHVWDIFSARVRGEASTLNDLIRPCPTVSELERVSGLLAEMREGSHIAIVVDEFGGTAGLVTLSDLLEELVGSIDEGGDSDEDADYRRTEAGGYEVQSRMHVEDLEELLGQPLPAGDFDTVGGLIITELGRIPVKGEQLTVAGLNIHVQDADPRRLIQILIKPDRENG